MVSTTQKKKADDFLAMHHARAMLVLPNVWNPITARILASRGYGAVATASAAVAASLGYVDGERVKFATMLEMIGRIARSVEVPVSADIETGYGDTIAELEDNIRAVIDAGVVGINIEDSHEWGSALVETGRQCERIAAVRDVASRSGLHLVINARTDCFVTESGTDLDEAVAEAVGRAAAYVEAGADCVYPIAAPPAALAALRGGITCPINALVTNEYESLLPMREAGINRVTFGPFVFRSCLAKFIDIADALQNNDSTDCVWDRVLTRDQTEEFLISDKET